MNLIPDYTENIIVAVVLEGNLLWYVSDKEIWFLDYQKRIEAFKNKGYSINIDYIDESRKNNLVLDTSNALDFLNLIQENEATVEELRESLLKSKSDVDDSWKYDYRPSLYVNFDKKILYSNYSEPSSYEDYAPEFWDSKYKDFENEIPSSKKYWLSHNGDNLFND
ncbi:hypothetical protein IW492_14235 [Enterococcus sp. BWB1-3]|uniref:hypothetical protein n=1 Tax=Enterococcus sp. BWB1-3 TaxID=2787713 RepID=UPI001920D030|nr:hypothetical protein [Enterococcus sp. BWB1-3]MBL1230389.1 hypothetical protein [Enterococcus sp. BWB1-3]